MSLTAVDNPIFQPNHMQHNKNRAGIGFDLWALIGAMRVFYRQLVQGKLFFQSLQHGLIRFVQAKPNKCVWILQGSLNSVDCHPTLSDSLLVGGYVDRGTHFFIYACERGGME